MYASIPACISFHEAICGCVLRMLHACVEIGADEVAGNGAKSMHMYVVIADMCVCIHSCTYIHGRICCYSSQYWRANTRRIFSDTQACTLSRRVSVSFKFSIFSTPINDTSKTCEPFHFLPCHSWRYCRDTCFLKFALVRMIGQVELEHVMNEKVRTFSGGMKRRLSVAISVSVRM